MVCALELVRGSARFKCAGAVGVGLWALAALTGGSAGAASSTTELAAGGLTLVNGASIETRSEDLYVSPGEIRVSYRFFNTSPEDVKTLLQFAMPDVTVGDAATDVPLPTADPQNLLGFSARANGVPVKAQAVQKVYARGIDRTADLRRMKVPLAPHLPATGKALGRLPPGAGDELAAYGLATVKEHGAGRGMRRQLSPRWTLKTMYVWEQVFPAGREMMIDHSYKPSVGRSAQTFLGDPEATKESRFAAYLRKYCIDQELLDAVAHARRSAGTPYGAPFAEERVSYLLSTDANPAGPIGEFRLVVDKGAPTSLVSFCGENVRRIGPTRYEVRKSGFSPTTDLHVLILKRSRGL